MTRPLMKLAPLGMVLTLVLAACGGAIGPSATAQPTPPPSGAATPTEAPFPTGDINIELWTKEGDPNIAYIEKLGIYYTGLHKNVHFKVVNKDVETLREDMVNTALAPDTQPQLLWTVADHIGPFTAAGVIQELTGQIDESLYAPSALAGAKVGDQLWAVPISNGNQLMLYYNKSLIPNPPADTDTMIALAKQNTDTAKKTYGLVYNQTESFWLMPWIGGFGGSVFKSDGKTPDLTSDAMKNSLQFLYDLKYVDKVMPSSCDYNCASDLFTTGAASMIINGDWELANYADKLGDNLGVEPLPKINATGKYPAPYTAGAYWMVPKSVSGDTLTVVMDFIKWSTNKDNQVQMVQALKRLPANNEALADPVVTGDPLLKGAADAVQLGTPQPTNIEMRCVFDATKNIGMNEVVVKGNSNITDVMKKMQTAAENCVATQG
jgi:arabinogalactan oligomer/maltooligosaccharide transport system substrate-binding protein